MEVTETLQGFTKTIFRECLTTILRDLSMQGKGQLSSDNKSIRDD